jgi:hypothetical protein
MSKMQAWKVMRDVTYLKNGMPQFHSQHLTTVYFDLDMDRNTVRDSLINHDGFMPDIYIFQDK